MSGACARALLCLCCLPAHACGAPRRVLLLRPHVSLAHTHAHARACTHTLTHMRTPPHALMFAPAVHRLPSVYTRLVLPLVGPDGTDGAVQRRLLLRERRGAGDARGPLVRVAVPRGQLLPAGVLGRRALLRGALQRVARARRGRVVHAVPARDALQCERPHAADGRVRAGVLLRRRRIHERAR